MAVIEQMAELLCGKQDYLAMDIGVSDHVIAKTKTTQIQQKTSKHTHFARAL